MVDTNILVYINPFSAGTVILTSIVDLRTDIINSL